MSSTNKLEKKDPRRHIPLQLNVFLRNDDDGEVREVTQNANTSSIGTIPSNGLVESDVTPIMTPTPKAGVYKPNVNVWRLSKEVTKPDRSFVVSAEEYPDLGQRPKRFKQRTPRVRNQDDGGTVSCLASRFSRVKDPPVLGNFLPDFMLPKSSNSNHQSVTTWLSSVRPSDSQKSLSDQARCSSSTNITLLSKDSVQPLTPKSSAQSSPGEKNIQQEQNTPAKSQQEETSPANSVEHQQKTPNSPKEQQKSSVGLTNMQQKASGNSLQQQNSSASSLQQQNSSVHSLQKRKSWVNSSQQQRSSVNFIQKQRSWVNSSHHQKSSASSLQQKSSENSPSKFQQQQQKSPANNERSQNNQKSPGIQHSWKQQQQQKPKILQNCPKTSVQQQMNPVNHTQSQSERPTELIYLHSRSPAKRASVTNNSSAPIRIAPRQQTTQSSGPSVVHNEDEDVMPPTPNQSERRQRRFPRRNHNPRMVRSLQAVSREFTESLLEGSSGKTPEKEVVPYQQQEKPRQVKSSPEIHASSHMRKLAMGSVLNSNAKEFHPTGESHLTHKVSRLSQRRCRQRFTRSLHAKKNNPREQLPNPDSAPEPILEYTSEIDDQPCPPRQTVDTPIEAIVPPAMIEVSATGNLPPVFYFDQQSGIIWSNSSPQIPVEIQSNSVSQSVFRLASLPCTGVGTTNMDIFTSSPPPIQHMSSSRLPSSISGPTQLSHTLSSPPVENQHQQHLWESCIHQDEDLMYSRPLLDMDQEETQPEQQDQEWQWESEIEPPSFQSENQVVADEHGEENAYLAKDAGPPLERHMIFRAPSQHGQEYPKPDLNCVPSSIKKLHHLISSQYSDYSFVYALSAQISQDCVPMDCFVYLKMILLASIVSIESDEVRAPISLCIIATDSLMANRLLNKVGQLAPRFLGPHEYGLQPTFNALPTRFNWIVASPLLLAQQGVYYAGDWNRLSKDQGCQLEKCIENGAVPVPQLHIDQPLKAAVWTYWQPNNSTNQTLALAKLCPIFGLPIYMGAQASNSLWNSIIQKHNAEGQIVVNDGLSIPEDDMRMLIHLLHQRKTTLTDGAQHMLQKYYVISRKERPNVFSSKTYIVLKQLAECFAKLALRLEVLESDVCVAIFHCEHFVQGIFGAKENQAPPAVFNFNVISCIDPYMNKFTRWLLQYLNSYEDEELGMHADKRRRTDSWDMP